MLRNYLTTAFRALKNRPVVSGINITGLAVGLAACLLISLWVRQELRYDRFHPGAEDVYRIALEAQAQDRELTAPVSPPPLAAALQRDVPEVAAATRIDDQPETIVRVGGERFAEDQFYAADSSFFAVFSGFDLLRGDPSTALAAPDAVVLTRSTAQRYFGRTDVLGETVEVGETTRRVTGVVADVPAASHFHYDLIASVEPLAQQPVLWLQNSVYTYVRLHTSSDPSAFTAAVDRVAKQYVGPRAAEALNMPMSQWLEQSGMHYFTQRLTDIHLHSNLQYELEPNGSLATVWIFGAVALFILLIACINFTNLATARATERAGEVGMRKALGATRRQLAGQFLGEALLTTATAFVLALALAAIALPVFNQIAGTQLPLVHALQGPMGVALVGGVVLVGLIAGVYPALVLSGFAPSTVLKGSGRQRSGGSGRRLRQGLVVVQFVISIALIAGTLAVWNQFDYIQSKRLGLDKEHVVAIDRSQPLGDQQASFKEQLRQLPGVVEVGASNAMFDQGSRGLGNYNFVPDDRPPSEGTTLSSFSVDARFAEVMNIDVVAGRTFDPARTTDTSAVVVNQAAAQALGWETPTQHTLRTTGPQGQRYAVIGVVEDFHFQSLRQSINPLVLTLAEAPRQVLVRVKPGDPSSTLASVRQTWQQFAPDTPLSYTFLDARFERLHDDTQRTARLFVIFAGLAIAIACFGLFGLATYTAQRRTKEIGIRKALGATATQIVGLLSTDFLKLVGIAFVVATPLAYLGLRRWLQDFAYRMDLGAGLFIGAGVLVLAIAFLTVSVQALRAARLDPATTLRDE